MCAILDACVVGEVFGERRTPAGKQFFDWLETPRARLVVGGTLFDELAKHRRFEKWAETAIADGRMRRFRREDIDVAAAGLSQAQAKSDDPHVIALACVSRARILYSDDGDLRDDFRNTQLVPRPQGKIFPLGESATARQHRRNLLGRTRFCPNR